MRAFFLTLLTFSQEPVLIDETVKVQYQIESALPNSFFSQLDPAPLKMVSYHVTPQENGFTLDFELQPTRIGTNIFAPGAPLPAVKIECVPTGLSSFELPPLVGIGKKISLSEKNRFLIQDPDTFKREKERNEARLRRYKSAWGILFGFLTTLGAAGLILWGLVEYELWRRRKIKPAAKVDVRAQLLQEARDVNRPLSERFYKLFLLMRDNPQFASSLPRLEAICFGNADTSEEEWQQYLPKLLTLRKSD